MEMLIGVLCALIFGLGLCCAIYSVKTHRRKKMTQFIAGPRPLPLVGNGLNMAHYAEDLMPYLDKLQRQYQSNFRLWSCHHLLVFVVTLEDVKQIFSDKQVLHKAYPYDYIASHLGEGLVTSVDSRWSQDRKQLTPFFHISSLKKYVETYNRKIGTFLEKLSKHLDGPEINIFSMVSFCVLDIVLATTFGQDVMDSEILQLLDTIKCMQHIMTYRIQRPWLDMDPLYRMTKAGRDETRSVNNTYRIMKGFMKRREECTRTDNSDGFVILDLLLEMMNKKVIQEKDAVDQMNTLGAAGTETSSTCLALTCWLLSKHPDIQDKVVQELKEIFGDSDRPATYEDLRRMKYLDMVIKESLRLYPVVPIVGRKLTEDYKLGNNMLPAGTNLIIYILGIQRNAEYFADPLKFDPERFRPKNMKSGNSFCYFPFSGGYRNCIGQRYAMLMMKTVLSALLRRFKILPVDTPLSITFEVIINLKNGVPVKLTKR